MQDNENTLDVVACVAHVSSLPRFCILSEVSLLKYKCQEADSFHYPQYAAYAWKGICFRKLYFLSFSEHFCFNRNIHKG